MQVALTSTQRRPMSSVSATFLILVLLTICPSPLYALRCLVQRLGHGLVSEKCSIPAAFCRVRIENNAIVWYESILYDGMQLACVHKSEYGTKLRSGCMWKPSGTRCWCYGQSNCNTPENMMALYEAFKAGDQKILDEVIDSIETSDVEDYDEGESLESTIETPITDKMTETAGKMAPKLVPETTTILYESHTKQRNEGALQKPATTTTYNHGSESEEFWSSDKITTNKSYRQRVGTSEGIHPTETVKILPKSLENENNKPKRKQIRIQSDRIRRKEMRESNARKIHVSVCSFIIVTVLRYGTNI